MDGRLRSKSSLGSFRERGDRDKDFLRREATAGLLDRHLQQENRRPSSALGRRNTTEMDFFAKPASPRSRYPTTLSALQPRDMNRLEDPLPLPRELGRKRSKLSEHLEGMGNAESPVNRLESTIGPLIDDVLSAMHKAEKHARVSANGLEQHVNLEHRRKVVAWLVKAFHVVSFEDQILYGTVHLADLYLDGCKQFVSGSILQSVVMACVCTQLKLATADHRVYSVPDLIAHITHNQITLERVLRVERDVLVGVDFNVCAPTMHAFLESFSLRLTPEKTTVACADWCGSTVVPAVEAVVGGPALARPKFFHLADFLCQLSLLHHELLDYLPSLVAASALILSVWTLRGPSAVKQVLLEDVGCIWDVKGKDLRLCVAALHKEWVCPTDREASVSVLEKFATPERQEVSDIPAPAAAPAFA
jgi:hypothetical protein